MHCVSVRQGLSPYRLDHRADTLLSMYHAYPVVEQLTNPDRLHYPIRNL
jgi:hypothetical protein